MSPEYLARKLKRLGLPVPEPIAIADAEARRARRKPAVRPRGATAQGRAAMAGREAEVLMTTNQTTPEMTMQRIATVIQAAGKDLRKLAFLIEANPGYVIKDTLWFSDVETVADAITRVSVDIEALLPNSAIDGPEPAKATP